MSQQIVIGKITTSQGNKGEVRVSPWTDFPERFTALKEVILDYSSRQQKNYGQENTEISTKEKKEIESVRFHKNFVVIKFAGIDDIEAALSLKDCLVKISEEELVPLAEDNYYIYQLRGAVVKTTSGKLLGELKDVLKTGGTDIFLVRGEEKEYMLPASKEIITEIDIGEMQIIVEPVPGLLDL